MADQVLDDFIKAKEPPEGDAAFAKEAPQPYSPTSEASDAEDDPFGDRKDGLGTGGLPVGKPGGLASKFVEKKEMAPLFVQGLNSPDEFVEEPAAAGEARSVPAASPVLRRPVGPCPRLITGSRLDKVVDVLPNHWLKMGRHPKAQLLLNNAGISRNQCSVRWDTHEQKLELRIEASSGTFVNGRPYSLERVFLEHGDRIRISGKGQMFDFIVDLRLVGLGLGDPRQVARESKAATAPAGRRDRLRAMLLALKKSIKEVEASTFDMEKEFYETQMRRKLRGDDVQEMERRYEWYLEDTKRLEKHLLEGRQEWLERLDKENDLNEDGIRPLIVETAGLQDKVEKLQLKKDELARSIHPERYAVADVAVMELDLPAQNDGRGSDEEDAFAGLSGLEDNRASGAEASEDEARPIAKPVEKAAGVLAPPEAEKSTEVEKAAGVLAPPEAEKSTEAPGDKRAQDDNSDAEALLPAAKRSKTEATTPGMLE